MNTNSRNDPMLSSFVRQDRCKFPVTPVFNISASHLVAPISRSPAFIISMDSLLSPDPSTGLSDLTAVWSSEPKGVVSMKTEEEERYLASPYAPSGETDNGDIVMEDIDIASNTTVANIKIEIEDTEFDDSNMADNSLDSHECNSEYDPLLVDSSLDRHRCKREVSAFLMSESEARSYVEEQFEKIAFIPSSKLSQREKIEFILAKSDCFEYSVDNVMNFDKRSPESARACARIVQNIPQRYRWECILPEDIPSCYTIVADCKKVSSRDKPPRPMNAFMIWAQGARRLINELCPKMQNALISEALGYYWRQKSDAFKKSFEQEKIKLRRFHNVEFPEYKYKPKTKVQKAKEKQELSLTKAKMRASVKREKLHLTEDANISERRTKCGRPRKSKSNYGRKDIIASPPSQREISEQLLGNSVTKPAIKDMLTLKILGDRRLKATSKTTSDSRVLVHSAFGQLSPLELDSPYISDIFEDLDNFNMALVDHTSLDKDSSSKVLPSSVYDTPANTPPVDFDHELRLSPLQLQPTSSSWSSPSPTTVTSKESSLSTSNKAAITKSDSGMLMTSHTSRQISQTTSVSHVRGSYGLSQTDIVNKSTSISTNMQLSSPQTNNIREFSDLLFTYVTEALSSGPMNQKYNLSSNIHNDTNNSSQSDDNNNNIDITLSYTTSVRNSKAQNFVNESNDLDTLRLDLNSPILSDDDMRSLLNSL